MKYLKLFNEGVSDIYEKNIRKVYNDLKEDIEDCLLHLSDKFGIFINGMDGKNIKVENFYMYTFKIDSIDIDKFTNDLTHVNNDLKRIGMRCEFNIDWRFMKIPDVINHNEQSFLISKLKNNWMDSTRASKSSPTRGNRFYDSIGQVFFSLEENTFIQMLKSFSNKNNDLDIYYINVFIL